VTSGRWCRCPKCSEISWLTPLHYAAHDGNQSLVELLIANGANVNAKDREGLTSLERARREGRDEIAQLLQNKPEPPSGKLGRIVASIWRSVSGTGNRSCGQVGV